MRKFAFILVGFLLLFSCGNINKTGKEDYGMRTIMEMRASEYQLDSICISDTLSQNIEDWLNAEFISYETGDTIPKYVWIKQWSCGTMIKYVITGRVEPFLVEKTIISKAKQ